MRDAVHGAQYTRAKKIQEDIISVESTRICRNRYFLLLQGIFSYIIHPYSYSFKGILIMLFEMLSWEEKDYESRTF